MTAEELWSQFCIEKNIDKETPYEAWAFGGNPGVGDELARLVIEGKKFGTASAYDLYVEEDALDEIPKIGDYSVILYENDEAVCVIKNYEVYITKFSDVTPFHAFSEGEGDLSLAYWKRVHRDFFTPDLEEFGLSLTEESMVVCEKFSVEYKAGEEVNDELIFAEPSMTFADEIVAYRQEMLDAKSDFDGCFSLMRMEDPKEYIDYCLEWSNPSRPKASHGTWGNVVLCIRKSDGKMIGSFQVQNVLNEKMEKYTGYVGYSVRPSERRKGYATKMLAKAKEFLSSFGFDEITVSCLPDNIGSKKTIVKNGGEYLETVYLEDDKVELERYKIRL